MIYFSRLSLKDVAAAAASVDAPKMICCDEKLSENRNVEKQLMLKLSTTRGFSAEPAAVLRASVETLRQLYYCCADQLNFLAALLPTAELRLLFSLVL